MVTAERQNRLVEWEPTTLELREDPGGGPGIVSATLMVYGDTADIYGVKESVAPDAFGEPENLGLRANYMHQRAQPLGNSKTNLQVKDSPTRLTAELTLPDNTRGRDAAVDIREGLIEGASVDFYMEKYDLDVKARTIRQTRARLVGFGIVDIPAFKRSRIQLRWEDYAPIDFERAIWL